MNIRAIALPIILALSGCAEEAQIMDDPSTGLVLFNGASESNFGNSSNIQVSIFNDTDDDITNVECRVWALGDNGLLGTGYPVAFDLASGQYKATGVTINTNGFGDVTSVDVKCTYQVGRTEMTISGVRDV